MDNLIPLWMDRDKRKTVYVDFRLCFTYRVLYHTRKISPHLYNISQELRLFVSYLLITPGA